MLNADGQWIEIDAVFTFASNGNNKRIKLHFGGTAIYDSGAVAENGGSVVVRARIVRTGAATQRASAWVVGGTLVVDDHQYATPAETLSRAITIKSTGEATTDNDIVATMTRVAWQQALN